MRTLKYWKKIELPGTRIVTMLVPEQTVTEPSMAFDALLAAVKADGMSYVLYDTQETLIEERRTNEFDGTSHLERFKLRDEC